MSWFNLELHPASNTGNKPWPVASGFMLVFEDLCNQWFKVSSDTIIG